MFFCPPLSQLARLSNTISARRLLEPFGAKAKMGFTRPFFQCNSWSSLMSGGFLSNTVISCSSLVPFSHVSAQTLFPTTGTIAALISHAYCFLFSSVS